MSAGVLESLKEAVMHYDKERAASWAKKALDEGIDPLKAADALTEAAGEIGAGFSRGDLFLPDLVGAAEAMQSAMPLIQEAIKRAGKVRGTLGTVVIGTVFGDIHSIGKDMVSTLLAAGGFTIHDLGISVSAEAFLEAVKTYEPDILAMSALLTTTASEQRKVIGSLQKENLGDRVKVMVGGGAVTEEFAREIGADGYGATAADAVELAKRLIDRKRG